jgi:hypothetical protein
MSDGFRCCDGWYDITFHLCKRLEPLVANLDDSAEEFQVLQVKEKFGELRFYVNQRTDEIREAIRSACQLSRRTCELCGKDVGSLAQRGALRRPAANGLFNTFCLSCGELAQSASERSRQFKRHRNF